MQITQDLKLTFPVGWSDAGKPIIYAYHTPIAREVYEANWRIISATAAKMLRPGVAPEVMWVATLALKDAGRADAIENGLAERLDYDAGGTANALLGELKRTTFILSPSPTGYRMLPVDVAIGQKVIDLADWEAAENQLVFFTCGWWSANPRGRSVSATILASALGGSITSSSPTDFLASLPTSTPVETSDQAKPPTETGSTTQVPQ